MREVKVCVVRGCGKPYNEDNFYKGQIRCKDCQKNRRKARLSKRGIEGLLKECCACKRKEGLIFLTIKPLSSYTDIQDIQKIPVICMNCLLRNQKLQSEGRELNSRPSAYKTLALTAELPSEWTLVKFATPARRIKGGPKHAHLTHKVRLLFDLLVHFVGAERSPLLNVNHHLAFTLIRIHNQLLMVSKQRQPLCTFSFNAGVFQSPLFQYTRRRPKRVIASSTPMLSLDQSCLFPPYVLHSLIYWDSVWGFNWQGSLYAHSLCTFTLRLFDLLHLAEYGAIANFPQLGYTLANHSAPFLTLIG